MKLLNFLFHFTFLDFQNPKYALDINCKNGFSTESLFQMESIDFAIGIDDYNYKNEFKIKKNTYFTLKKDFEYNLYYQQFDIIQLNFPTYTDIKYCDFFYNLLKKDGKFCIRENGLKNSYYEMLEKNNLERKLPESHTKFKKHFTLTDKKMINNRQILIYKKKMNTVFLK